MRTPASDSTTRGNTREHSVGERRHCYGESHTRSTLAEVTSSEQRRYDRNWKLSASLLGIMALVAASTAVRRVEPDAPWDLALYFVFITILVLAGTVWLVPSSRGRRSSEGGHGSLGIDRRSSTRRSRTPDG
jgi:hypothetical protein